MILPNIASSLIFNGIGAQPPHKRVGGEVSTAAQHMFDFPQYVVVPGTALFLAVFSVNVLGDAIREALDPRLAEA